MGTFVDSCMRILVYLLSSPPYYRVPVSCSSVSDKLLKLDRFRKLLFEVMTALRQVRS